MRVFGAFDVKTAEGESYRWEPDEITPGEELMILAEVAEKNYDTYEDWILGVWNPDKKRRVGGVTNAEAVATQTLIWFLRRKLGRQEDRMGVVIKHLQVEFTQVEPPEGDSPEASAASDSPTSEAAT